MKKEFTKKDLKNGMVVEYRDGEKALFLESKFIGTENWMGLGFYEEDLICNGDKECDIVRVYEIDDLDEIRNFTDLADIYKKTDILGLLWEREEKKPQYTMEELKAIVGHDFEMLF